MRVKKDTHASEKTEFKQHYREKLPNKGTRKAKHSSIVTINHTTKESRAAWYKAG